MTGLSASTPPSGRPRAAPRLAAPTRILQSAAACIVARGASQLSLQEVAEAADVSKGLIHYHFHDKETLLARLAEWMTDGIITRERAALTEATPQTAIERMWSWLAAELQRGHVRALGELGREPGALVRAAVQDSARRRRAAAAETADRLYVALGLKPRIPAGFLAEVMVAFVDGVAIDLTLRPETDGRVAFDVFWLAMLSLAE